MSLEIFKKLNKFFFIRFCFFHHFNRGIENKGYELSVEFRIL